MVLFAQLAAWASQIVDDVVAALLALAGVFRPRRKVQIVEQEDGAMVVRAARRRLPGKMAEDALRWEDGRFTGTASAGALARIARCHVEVILLPRRFLLRPLELPRRAADFLDGIVRAQIDRLTPWSPSEAAFGWSAPVALPGDRVSVTVAATAKALVAPIADAVAAMRADSVVISTALEGASADAPRIRILAQGAGGGQRARRLRAIVVAAPAALGLAALAALGAWLYLGGDLEAQRAEIAKKIAMRRVELASGRASPSDEAVAALDSKKRATPASVIVLESLSLALPDDTYLTELHVDGAKLQIAGLTRDAPSLIRIIEQAHQFSHATFFAPTTRAPTENGERFHIEAEIAPYYPEAK